MAHPDSFGLSPQLDIKQLQLEAQHRWLRPAEICEVLRNYQNFQIASEPSSRPISGSLFLFDRKVLRYFRKDGHNWRKKKDGKTVKEAHEKLKVGSVDVLHCYYAHGEENENFQRRSYWMLEPEFMHIVFVHYLEVKGNRTNVSGIRENEETSESFQKDSPTSQSFSANNSAALSGNTDSASPTSTLTSLCEDADSDLARRHAEKIHRSSMGFLSLPEMQQIGEVSPVTKMSSASMSTSYSRAYQDNLEDRSSQPVVKFSSNIDVGGPTNYGNSLHTQKSLGVGSWEDILKQSLSGPSVVPPRTFMTSNREPAIPSNLLGDQTISGQLHGGLVSTLSNWQPSSEDIGMPGWTMDHSLDLDSAYQPDTSFLKRAIEDPSSQGTQEYPQSLYGVPAQQYGQFDLSIQENRVTNSVFSYEMIANARKDLPSEGEVNFAFTARRLLSDGDDSMKKVDSFSRWISKELDEVEDIHIHSTTGISWSAVECENVADESSLSPSISQDQLFSITDFSPKWAHTDSEIQVLIIGTFLKYYKEAANCSWSCMFGEMEVPTQILADGLLTCRAPVHNVGQVPFYVTCSNRLACSEVREFDYLVGSFRKVDISDLCDNMEEYDFLLRLEELLSLNTLSNLSISSEGLPLKRNTIEKIIALKEEEESQRFVKPGSDGDFHELDAKEHLILKVLKEKLYSWLLHKIAEDGKGPCILDEQGQGVLHMVSALGYDWSIKPIVDAGVAINFRDVNGWTALHWAACCGRERTVCVLLSLGAAPGLLTDPSPENPPGRTPADLASANGHKGISGFLAESSLTSHLSLLTVNDATDDTVKEINKNKAVQIISERFTAPIGVGDIPDAVSLKDSLTAVCNATQAADRIYQMFRLQSFHRKKLEIIDDDSEDEREIALAFAKTGRVSQNDGLANTAAIQIQKKFRGWKKRKEFLVIRRRIVKIQAHFRGHQVRKQYKTIIWSVSILEKIILRWRRKGSGLRGYHANKDSNQPALPQKEDDYDFLKEGRKQTEERFQKALSRVKSMVQYPEARAQYSRLLMVVENIRENKASDMALSNPEPVAQGDEDLIDIDGLFDDETLMSMTFD